MDGIDDETHNRRLYVLNEAVMHGVTATGKALLSHTKLNDKLTLRLSIGNIRTTEKQVRQVWELLNEQLKLLLSPKSNVQSPTPDSDRVG